MHNSNIRTPRRMGPGSKMGAVEKPKDLKSAISRLFKELKGFKILILISLVLAVLGSVLSILAPDKLSDLTDEISKGLVVNSNNLEILSQSVASKVDEDTLSNIIPEILKMNVSEDVVNRIMSSDDIPQEDKKMFLAVNLLIVKENDNFLQKISMLSDKILGIIFEDSIYNGIKISRDDKIAFIKNNISVEPKKIQFPKSIEQVIFDEFELDGVRISSGDQVDFLNKLSTFDENFNASELYQKMDEMPVSIQRVVKPSMNMNGIKVIALFLAGLYVCSAVFNYIQSLLMTTVSNKFSKSLRGSISKKINRLPLKYFDKNATGDMLSRVTNDVDMIAHSMNQSLATLVSSVTLFVGTVVMMFYTNWIMALTAILASLFGFIFMSIVLGKSQKYFVSRQVELGNLNGHIEEVYSGLNIVKTYNGKKESDIKFDEYNKKVYDANRKSQFLSGLMMPMMNFIGNFGYVAICIVGALLTMNDYISFGVIVAFMTYVRLFTSPLSQIAQAMTSMQSTAAASERVFEILDEEEMIEEQKLEALDKEQVKGNIEFCNVVFKYDGNDKPTINNFSAVAKAGQKVAIVGPTGAGKTTMVNLLMKFYEINSGDIKIDGVSTKKLTRENIHELFTMVLQDAWLFNGTVKENIVYNREDISDEKVKEVCKIVGLDHFIKTLPHGYDSIISDNDSVSAGQRQLLTIARGMIKDAPFLILDEATSNVDTRTEELVQKAMDKLTEGKTSFIIAHRLSTIKNADLILVMKDGNIVEQGNHKQLMKKNGFYAELYNSQFEL